MRNVLLIAAIAVVLACSRENSAPEPASSTTSSSALSAAAIAPVNDGTDPKTPVLAPDDATFADTRHGWGWSDRCWKEEHAGKYGWALAACQRGLDLSDLDAKVKPSLLYNDGVALEGGGDKAGARGYYERSLALRSPNDPGRAEVAAALARVGGPPAPGPAPPSTLGDRCDPDHPTCPSGFTCGKVGSGPLSYFCVAGASPQQGQAPGLPGHTPFNELSK